MKLKANPRPESEGPGAVAGELPGFAPLDEGGLEHARAVGVDSGATLVKVCVQTASEQIQRATWPAAALERVLGLLERLTPDRIGVTGCGARAIVAGLARPATSLLEFDAWGHGANRLLREMGRPPAGAYLLVSIGTGTSALRVEGERIERVGGSALGGGTALGLGYALTGARSHRELARLAACGERGGVDLLISDIYHEADISLAGAATAASFGKLARRLEAVAPETIASVASTTAGVAGAAAEGPPEASGEESPRVEDLAAAIMGLVAENIALICNAHARTAGVSTIVYGGSTLAENPSLIETVRVLTSVLGHECIVLAESGHAGALGAMLLAR